MELNKKQLIIACAIIAIVGILSLGYIILDKSAENDSIEIISNDTISETTEPEGDFSDSEKDDIVLEHPEFVYVYVCGEVVNTGVYELPYGSRIIDAITLAGGLTPDANELAVNLAKIISDEQQIYIPKIGEEVEIIADSVQGDSDLDSSININTASLTELKTLSGIGDVIAQNIIEYREANGLFENIEDIKKVSRIGDKVFENIKDQITVD